MSIHTSLVQPVASHFRPGHTEAGQDSEDGTPVHGGPALPQVAQCGAGTQRPKAMCWQNAEGQSLGQVHPKGPGTGDKTQGKRSVRGVVETGRFSLQLGSAHVGAFSLAQAPSQALHLIWYSEFDFFFFPKEGPKFHKLQVPQNLNLFQAEKIERLRMQNSGGKGGLQTRPAPDIE